MATESNSLDAFLTNASESNDADSDGIGDNSDNCVNTANLTKPTPIDKPVVHVIPKLNNLRGFLSAYIQQPPTLSAIQVKPSLHADFRYGRHHRP